MALTAITGRILVKYRHRDKGNSIQKKKIPVLTSQSSHCLSPHPKSKELVADVLSWSLSSSRGVVIILIVYHMVMDGTAACITFETPSPVGNTEVTTVNECIYILTAVFSNPHILRKKSWQNGSFENLGVKGIQHTELSGKSLLQMALSYSPNTKLILTGSLCWQGWRTGWHYAVIIATQFASLCNSKTKDLLSLITFTDASVISWHESKVVVCRYLIVLCSCLPQWPLRDPEFYTGDYYLSLQHYDVFPNPNMWLCCGRVCIF